MPALIISFLFISFLRCVYCEKLKGPRDSLPCHISTYIYTFVYLMQSYLLSQDVFYDDVIYLCVSALLRRLAQEFTANNDSLENDQNSFHIFLHVPFDSFSTVESCVYFA